MGATIKKIFVIGLTLLLSYPCEAAIGFVQHVVGTTTPLTVASTGSGNILVVICASNTPGCSGITDNATGGSNTYTAVGGSAGSDVGFTGEIFVAANSKSGATSISAGSLSNGMLHFFEYTGAATSNPVDTSTGTTSGTCSGTTATSHNMTTTNTEDMVISGAFAGASITAVASPYGHFIEDANGDGSADWAPGSTSATGAVWTCLNSGDSFENSAVAILPAGTVTSSGVNKNRKIEMMQE